MRRVWESNMDSKLKRRLFVSTVECVTVVWLGDLDSDGTGREVTRRDVHPDAPKSAECHLGGPYDKLRTLRRSSQTLPEDKAPKDGTGWTLRPAYRADSQPAYPLGANRGKEEKGQETHNPHRQPKKGCWAQ
ncbi:Hypp3650 [Branchiostoma lanceolatum]|uniref:Hypp3650 protein n=1 Tax=Branchiostoma lanceolatum TaxID=7740 RepID=A0A8K0A2Z0_BRALA|nr:Hypp3650 [Branchiostoma lanceolatum]